MIYERIGLVSCQTQHRNFRVAEWPRSFANRGYEERRGDEEDKKARRKEEGGVRGMLGEKSPSDLIKDAVRRAGERTKRGMHGDDQAGRKEGTGGPLTLATRGCSTICGFHVFSTLRSPLRYITGGLVPL